MCFFFFKQKTAYHMRISDWSSDVCSSDLFDRVHHRQRGAAGDLGHAADIARGDELRADRFDIRRLAVAEPRRELRLQQVVGSRRAAAEMAFRHVEDLEPRLGEQGLWRLRYLLSMLHRAGGMIRHPQARDMARGARPDLGDVYGNVAVLCGPPGAAQNG